MSQIEKISELVNKSLPTEKLFLVDVKIIGKGRTKRVSVLIDGDEGVTIDQCGLVSSKLGELLDLDESIFDEEYQLEVGSPGAEEPLLLPRQYPKHINRSLQIETEDGTILSGVLKATNQTSLTLELDIPKKQKKDMPESEMIKKIEFKEIKKSKVILSFK